MIMCIPSTRGDIKATKTSDKKGLNMSAVKKICILLVFLPLLQSCAVKKQAGDNMNVCKAENRAVFFEDFNDNSLKWIVYDPAGQVRQPLIFDSVFYSFSPWWVDYNHAPPGAGYLHILAGLHTHSTSKWVSEKKMPVDFTNARVTLRLRGELQQKDSQMLILLQAKNETTTANFVLTTQPFSVLPQWSEQTITLAPDPSQWVCLGSRADRTETYGCFDVVDALKNMNVDFIFVLFPLNIEPVEPVADKHLRRAGNQYHVKQELLPDGIVMIDWVKIEFLTD